VITNFEEFIFSTIKQPLRPLSSDTRPKGDLIIEETAKVKDDSLELIIYRGQLSSTAQNAATPQKPLIGLGPVCRYINVELIGSGSEGKQATLLLENPKGEFPISFSLIVKQVKLVFQVDGTPVKLYRSRDKTGEITESNIGDVFSLSGSVVFALAGK